MILIGHPIDMPSLSPLGIGQSRGGKRACPVDGGRVRQCSLIAFVKLMVSATRLMVLFEVRTAPPQHGVGWVEPANVVYAVADRGRARAC